MWQLELTEYSNIAQPGRIQWEQCSNHSAPLLVPEIYLGRSSIFFFTLHRWGIWDPVGQGNTAGIWQPWVSFITGPCGDTFTHTHFQFSPRSSGLSSPLPHWTLPSCLRRDCLSLLLFIIAMPHGIAASGPWSSCRLQRAWWEWHLGPLRVCNTSLPKHHSPCEILANHPC